MIAAVRKAGIRGAGFDRQRAGAGELPGSMLCRAMTQTLAPNASVAIGNVTFANDRPIALFAGPCAMESRAHALEMASALKEICGRLGIGLVYKTSFDKANRTSLGARRGVGLDGALPVFAEIRASLGIPVVTDVHDVEQCARLAEVVDVLQIPAFLCRQTDLVRGRGQDRPPRQGQEGPVPRPLGHAERGRQGHRQRQPQRAGDGARRLVRLQHARRRHALARHHGPDRLPRDLRRHPRRAEPRRPGHGLRRRPPLRAGAGARRGGGGRRRRSSSRRTRTRTTPPPTAPTWSRSPSWRGCSAS